MGEQQTEVALWRILKVPRSIRGAPMYFYQIRLHICRTALREHASRSSYVMNLHILHAVPIYVSSDGILPIVLLRIEYLRGISRHSFRQKQHLPPISTLGRYVCSSDSSFSQQLCLHETRLSLLWHLRVDERHREHRS